MLMQRDHAAKNTLACWVVEAMVLMLTARMKGDGDRKNYVRVLFLEISDPEFQFWAIDPQQKWPEHIVNASYCSS